MIANAAITFGLMNLVRTTQPPQHRDGDATDPEDYAPRRDSIKVDPREFDASQFAPLGRHPASTTAG